MVTGFFPPLLTVSELTRQIRSNLEQQFPSVWVHGEISNLRRPASGHQYLTLKDQGSQIRAVLFRSQAQRLKFALQDGLEVIVQARLTVYEPRGDYQLLVEAVEPKGIGELQLAFKQLKEKLEAEGLFVKSRKRALPAFPERIGIATSPVGAAIQDLLSITHRRWPSAQILLVPVAVQGEAAVSEIVSAIQTLNHLDPQWGQVDVIIIGRGGGSLEDLWAFNEEPVVRAIADSRIPIVSAVGHETDVTLADLAADCRAPTPSAAAELVAPDCTTVKEQVHQHRRRLRQSFKNVVSRWTVQVQTLARRLPEPRLIIGHFVQRVDDLEHQLYQHAKQCCRNIQLFLLDRQSAMWEVNPLVKIHREQEALDALKNQIAQIIQKIVLEKRHRVTVRISQLQQLSPLGVLARGYAIVKDAQEEKVLKKSTDTSVGAEIHAILSEGELVCRVEDIRTVP